MKDMIALRYFAAIAMLGASHLSVEVGAQHSTPIALTASDQLGFTSPVITAVTRHRFDYFPSDTTETKPSVKPFLLGGALLGGIIGAAMASAYNPCGEPQPGVYCTSTDAATGAVIGAGVGIVVGWLAWVVATSNKK